MDENKELITIWDWWIDYDKQMIYCIGTKDNILYFSEAIRQDFSKEKE